MDKINGITETKYVRYDDFEKYENQVVWITGFIHRIREMTGFSFVIIRTGRDIIQCIYSPDFSDYRWDEKAVENSTVKILGKVVANVDAKGNKRYEIQIHDMVVLSTPADAMPITINKKQLDNMDINTMLNLRCIALRNPKERAIFRIQEGIARGFRDYLTKNEFTEIRTPKINFAGAEGGANIFKLDYFGKQVFLAQSPQFYKQMMVGVYGRVYEIGPVFRAEHHDTSRHLNEYISMDFEMGFIDSFYDIMNMETGALKYIMQLLKDEYQKELDLLQVKMPVIDEIPVITFKEAKDIIVNKFHKKITDFNDFEPEEEQLLCQYATKELGSEFLFVTHYPSKKRPFYALDDPNDPEYTLSFDLLFRGMEITTGGQRIHDYDMQVAKMRARGMNPDDFESYLTFHKYGAPPHGGLGLGLERLTMNLLGFKNVRYTSLFPRDINRVTP